MVARKGESRRRKRKVGKNVSLVRTRITKFVLTILFCGAVSAGVFYGLRHFFVNNPLFDVKDVTVTTSKGYFFEQGEQNIKNLYRGRNIFSINLKQVQLLFENEFPQVKEVEVKRILPDKIEIDVIGREPRALINFGGGIIIDKDAVVLAIGAKAENLVQIQGITFFMNMPRKGETIKNEFLDKALLLCEGLYENMKMYRKEVKYIDISDRNSIVLGFCDVEIKMGASGFSKKIAKLKEIREDPNMRMGDIRYVDLRFEDSVISLK
ncbi:MAG: FtsQ-type POTRA domain-containing protein [Candidatus Omnitrophota bacterium]